MGLEYYRVRLRRSRIKLLSVLHDLLTYAICHIVLYCWCLCNIQILISFTPKISTWVRCMMLSRSLSSTQFFFKHTPPILMFMNCTISSSQGDIFLHCVVYSCSCVNYMVVYSCYKLLLYILNSFTCCVCALISVFIKLYVNIVYIVSMNIILKSCCICIYLCV